MKQFNRRNFIRTSMMGGIGAVYLNRTKPFEYLNTKGLSQANVALAYGDNRSDIVFRALKPFSHEIKQAIGNRRVVLKPNVVSNTIQLAVTHVETLEGILEFLKSIRKSDNVIIAESAAQGPTLEGFSNFGYNALLKKYPVKLVDLDNEPSEIVYVFNEKDFRPHPTRVSRIMLDPDSYIVSVARMKTHSMVVATLSLKNIILGAPIKDLGFIWSRDVDGSERKNDKITIHGGGFRGINYNLSVIASRLHPHLSVIDGFEGMEGNGPTGGTPVDHRICVAGTDWLAADRIAVELMGIDYSKVGYLNYCAQTGLGIADLNKIGIIGERLDDHKKTYRVSDNYKEQLIWMTPIS
jgi:uncharacterized protein (DUF362 family)